MKIYRTVNPVAYENTYYLENDHSLILVDPGSDWTTIQKQLIVSVNHRSDSFNPYALRSHYES